MLAPEIQTQADRLVDTAINVLGLTPRETMIVAAMSALHGGSSLADPDVQEWLRGMTALAEQAAAKRDNP